MADGLLLSLVPDQLAAFGELQAERRPDAAKVAIATLLIALHLRDPLPDPVALTPISMVCPS